MELKKILDKYKKIILPEIKDWSLPYDELRTRKDWWHMPHIQWFVFHTNAYKYVLFNICLGSSISFLSVSGLFYSRNNNVLAVIFLLLGLRMSYATFLKLKSWKVLNTCNFYDLLFREYY